MAYSLNTGSAAKTSRRRLSYSAIAPAVAQQEWESIFASHFAAKP